jgi:YVTN family beta-propeller protein
MSMKRTWTGLFVVTAAVLLAPAGSSRAAEEPAVGPVENRDTAGAGTRPAATNTASRAAAERDWTLMKVWGDGSNLTQTGHLIAPAGESTRVNGRVLNLVLAGGGRFIVVKSHTQISVVDAETLKVVQQSPLPHKDDRGSMNGLAVGRDGLSLYFTDNSRNLHTATLDNEGHLALGASIDLSAGRKTVNPLGVGLTPGGKVAVVALSIANEVAVVDLAAGKVIARIPVGICPYDVLVEPDGHMVWVSNFGGSHPEWREKTEKSSGTDVPVDGRGMALRGTVSLIDLDRRKVVAELETRINPEAMQRSPDGKFLYVVDASGDGVSVIDIARRKVIRELNTKPSAELPYGSLTSALAVSGDGRTLYAANAGNNAVALIDLERPNDPPRALIPAGGFPGALCLRGRDLFIGNVYGYLGNIQRVRLPDSPEAWAAMTRTAQNGFHLADILRAQARASSDVPPVPVPASIGEPSTIRHIVYIIKENKKFDQVLGDIGRGNCEPKFCEFPRASTPNAHALADQFVLLDNYYCNGVLSCDGHQWAVQGVTTAVREKDWSNGRFPYGFGRDPLSYAGCGFIWDHLLRQGLSFRNFGELDSAVADKPATWSDFYDTWKQKSGKVTFHADLKIDTLRRYSDPRFPGWNLLIPDQIRADAFLAALAEFEDAVIMPEFVIIYLPNDHTQGGSKDFPTPRAYVADNDLALGRVVEGLSRSRFWKDMTIFINEDDPQTGADHVDGHRSICLLAGPYVRRGGPVVSRFYNQDSVLHTITRIFGVPPMNQTVAMAPVMTDCFQATPELTPFTCLPAGVPIDEMNPDPKNAPTKTQARLAPQTEKLDFSAPDRIDKDAELLSRFVWSTVRGDEAFPVRYTGAHGRGLKALGLRLDPNVRE